MFPRHPGGQGLIARLRRVLDPSEQSWAIGPPQNAVALSWWPGEPDPIIYPTGYDDTPQSWSVGPPLNADRLTFWPTGDPDPITYPWGQDDTPQSWSVGPPLNAVQVAWWPGDSGEVTYPWGQDDTPQAWSVQPPLNAVQLTYWNTPDDGVQFQQVQDDTPQPWTIQTVTVPPFDPSTGFPWIGDPEVVTLATWTDDSVQAWAVPPPFNATALQAWNVPEDQPLQNALYDDTALGWPVTPIPFVASWDEVFLPPWSVPDPTETGWFPQAPAAVFTPGLIQNDPEAILSPWWAATDQMLGWSAWAATQVVVVSLRFRAFSADYQTAAGGRSDRGLGLHSAGDRLLGPGSGSDRQQEPSQGSDRAVNPSSAEDG